MVRPNRAGSGVPTPERGKRTFHLPAFFCYSSACLPARTAVLVADRHAAVAVRCGASSAGDGMKGQRFYGPFGRRTRLSACLSQRHWSSSAGSPSIGSTMPSISPPSSSFHWIMYWIRISPRRGVSTVRSFGSTRPPSSRRSCLPRSHTSKGAGTPWPGHIGAGASRGIRSNGTSRPQAQWGCIRSRGARFRPPSATAFTTMSSWRRGPGMTFVPAGLTASTHESCQATRLS